MCRSKSRATSSTISAGTGFFWSTNALTRACSQSRLVTLANSASIAVNGLDRFRTENIGIFGPGNAQPLLNIAAGFLERELASLGAQRDALAELPELGLIEFLFELGLSGEHDLQQFFGGSLQIGEQADFFEHLRRKILRLVHDQHGALPGLIALEQPLVQLHAASGPSGAIRRGCRSRPS